MELIKKNVHMNKLKCRTNVQLTLDDDFNVPDVKPDIEQIIKDQATIVLHEVKPLNGKVMIRGSLLFNLLYISDGASRPVHNISGELPFEEVINMDETCSDDFVVTKWEIDDLTTSLINSRKISVKSIVSFTVLAENNYDEETAVAIEGDSNCHSMFKDLNITQVMMNKKDTIRVKDEIHIPNGKKNIYEILYDEMELRELETRVLEDKINIRGVLLVFILYTGDMDEQTPQYFETEVPFNSIIDVNGCNDSMVSNIDVNLTGKDLQIKTDDDGEERIIGCEAILELDMKVYVDEELEILSDCYSTAKDIAPVVKEAFYEQLVSKNNSKTRVTDRINIGAGQPSILQICNATGNVRIDDQVLMEDGVQTDGVLDVQILYISADDNKPLGAAKGVIPFSQFVEIKGLNNECVYEIKPSVEQISVIMLDGEEVEIKAALNLDTIAFRKLSEPIIVDIKENEFDLDKLQEMPSMVGYIVKPGDTLWKIAKQFHATVDSIKQMNDMETDLIHPGDKLLLLKRVDAV
ncbi:DUF3794 and LysM peptidoglycan-binding domain-containing protein [Anaeromicropila populeti]|uniref:LysM domain-containing protein n=1 Tax=Anaeromicropila populeti TaxID=37658 RepID=A0A1I6I655_9FIRM|nr:SPOCS domain-containing protein [Anaeromicropila populeti]SFR62181.1 LysM domain-containing protein [Anaeromicropila populeti]